jgi:hypothetical protein
VVDTEGHVQPAFLHLGHPLTMVARTIESLPTELPRLFSAWRKCITTISDARSWVGADPLSWANHQPERVTRQPWITPYISASIPAIHKCLHECARSSRGKITRHPNCTSRNCKTSRCHIPALRTIGASGRTPRLDIASSSLSGLSSTSQPAPSPFVPDPSQRSIWEAKLYGSGSVPAGYTISALALGLSARLFTKAFGSISIRPSAMRYSCPARFDSFEICASSASRATSASFWNGTVRFFWRSFSGCPDNSAVACFASPIFTSLSLRSSDSCLSLAASSKPWFEDNSPESSNY